MPRWLQAFLDLFTKEKPVAYPKSVTVSCDPNPLADEVSAYKFSLDGGAPILATNLGAPSVSLSVPTAGMHTFSVTASNAEGDSDLATLTKNFPAKPGKPGNLKIV